MTDTKWSEWIEWNATDDSVCPLEYGVFSEVQLLSGCRISNHKCPEEWDWNDTGGLSTICAYRYELTEDPDARMDNIARNGNDGEHYYSDITAYDPPGPTSMPECTFTTPDEDEAWREVEKKINPVWQSPHDFGGVCVFHGCRYSAYEQCYMCVLAGEAAKEEAKQARYQDTAGEDWIDEAARTFTAEEFRGAMRFSIGKYNRRMGKKDDLISEIEKMRDYCNRWLEVEQGR
jgi:hypothetical protein